jgi:hypothetical protein
MERKPSPTSIEPSLQYFDLLGGRYDVAGITYKEISSQDRIHI